MCSGNHTRGITILSISLLRDLLQPLPATTQLHDKMTLTSIANPTDVVKASTTIKASISAIESDNPLLRSWSDQPFNLPPFKDIRAEHFIPALEAGMTAHISDLEAIAANGNDFDSILGAYDRAGSLLSKVASVYGNYTSSLNTPDMQEVQTKMAPILSRHNSKAYDIPGLFVKIEKLYGMKDEKLKSGEWNAEQVRLAERVSTI